ELVRSETRLAISYPAIASSATMISRTNSTSVPRGAGAPERFWCGMGTRCRTGGTAASLSGEGSSLECGEPGGLVGLVEHLVDLGLRLLFLAPEGEHELGDEDLPGLGQHPLLAGGQALLSL